MVLTRVRSSISEGVKTVKGVKEQRIFEEVFTVEDRGEGGPVVD